MAEPGPAAAGESPIRRASGGLAIAAAIVAFGFIGSRLLGIVRTIVIAGAFGTSPELDAYNIAFRIPDLIFQVLAGATLGSAFIPVFARLYRREGEEEAWKLASHVLNLITAATAALCALAFLLAPWLVPLLAPGLGEDIGRHDELTDKAVELTRLMLLSTLFFAVSGMVTGILNGRQRFLLPALAPMLYNLAIIFGAVFFADRWGINGLAAGVVLGAGLHLAVQVPGLVREGMKWQPGFGRADPAVREVARLMGPRVIGLAAAQFNFVVTGFFASKVGASAISQLTYAWLLAGLPLALFGMALSTAVFPALAGHVADEDMDALRTTVSRVLRVIMFLTVPAAIGLAMLRDPATIVLLEHAEFTRIDSVFTASALGWYCLGIVPQAGIEIHSRGFYALGDTRTPVALAVAAVVVNLVLSGLLWGRYGHEGLAFSVSAASWLEWAVLYRLYAQRTGASVAADLRAMATVAVCGAGMALFLAVGLAPMEQGSWGENLVVAVAGAAAGAAVYAGLANLLHVEEIGEAVRRVSARFSRPAA
ncbi:MAG: murein biosynthesis integral membrane protein MurJ [Dehalococcoidia bacterium]|uniref:murein biosynthesis integral membrane protein MurJ n=1 Tax=Candidatus Amarobacter glycogenicus TaxID=3140699 RepID=UPI003135F3A8|nr:murein biosynthesis integral membrane protein MurJ [Dehalococcoidia bacterium]MBK8560836.1 murein biosynthesis integral membrane protein MurJ [Dehalococcoidia bacterium]